MTHVKSNSKGYRQGHIAYNHIKYMDRVANAIDKRTKSGERDADNASHYNINKDGRCWSF